MALQKCSAVAISRLLTIVASSNILGAPEHKSIAHALRAGLDIRKPGIEVLFAGSSEAALREMFSRAAAPFYNWAPVEPFPLLRHEFVAATVKQLATVAKHPLSLDDALKGFAALKETPEFFRCYIERYLIYQQQGPEQALRYIQTQIHDDTSYTKTWKDLNRADRAILLLAARGVQDLYGIHAIEQLKVLLGSPDVTVSAPRMSLRRLTSPKQQLLARVDHGAHRFEDPGFQAWVTTGRAVD